MDDTIRQIPRLATDALDLFISSAEGIPPESWDQPSNLENWSVRELVAHATGSAAKIVALIEGGEVGARPSQPADWISDQPVARLRESAARLRECLPGADFDAERDGPQGPGPLHRALAFPIADLALHSWDLHRSQGRLVDLPENLLAMCRGLVESVPDAALRRPGAFGPARPAPDGATPTSRLMAYLGRAV